MEDKPKILAFAGSTRSGSFNKKLLKLAVEAVNEARGEVTVIDLKDFPLPLYDGDIEESQGFPENALKLREMFGASDGFMIASPEYNSSISGVLKNMIDWVSRPDKDHPDLYYFRGKVAALLSTSNGWRGGLRGLVHLTDILGNIFVIVLTKQVTIVENRKAFDPDGNLLRERDITAVKSQAEQFISMLRKLKSE